MPTQLDLQVILKRPPKKSPSDFHEFWSEELHCEKKKKKKKTLLFEGYNLMDSVELGLITF
jgi:cephalosporin-C deacetylase-like acetyl esterase